MSGDGFTPGPWEADLDSGNISQGGDQIASAWVPRHRDNPHPERVANARLIAAAPELFEALQWLKLIYGQRPDHSKPELRAMQRAADALAKASREGVA
jgi:hypothetical protein